MDEQFLADVAHPSKLPGGEKQCRGWLHVILLFAAPSWGVCFEYTVHERYFP